MIALTRILVPTNLGEPSKAAVAYGVAFARRFGARLSLLRVLKAQDFDAAVEAERVLGTLVPEGATSTALTTEQVVQTVARAGLRQLLTSQEETDARAQYLLRGAGPAGAAHEIVTCAREIGCELIIMGKHRLGIVDHLLAGSVTERVLRQAPCPVLIVQHPEHEFVFPDASGEIGDA